MSEIIDQTVSDRICKHMNDDHQDAIMLYAQAFAKINDVQSATMISIDHEGMNIAVNNEVENPVRINFDHTLADAKDAHTTLVEMIKTAKAQQ
ncbi:DUF2470 domain-containing protein [Cyanobacterium stanieri LEGE 03274]|uniref:DUF2470 domain-containing protein n=1 Tax=Cyanobacterium stanieri LEGE 03274 TaxID=1828756 RepID=A0ABR9V6S5_9CHRO|nr:DUF2470 domain-containing protein [Cyanobacterium stanieri]MBE9222544.1 DUF2470 domain-containing protein [Cyanobacterium stanieri LEGE 03274]